MKALGARSAFYVGFVWGHVHPVRAPASGWVHAERGFLLNPRPRESLLEILKKKTRTGRRRGLLSSTSIILHHTGKYNVETNAYKKQTRYIHCMSTTSETFMTYVEPERR